MLSYVSPPLDPSAGWLLVAVALGACLGSFVGAASLRIVRGTGLVAPRSHCAGCRSALPAWALVPVFSYVLLGGRCARCRAGIPLRYPVLEAGLAVACGIAMHAVGPTLAFARIATAAALLALASLVDLDTRRIPNALALAGALAGLAAAGLADDLGPSLGAGATAAGALLGMRALGRALYGRPGAGMGDVKLALALGLLLGWEVLWMLYFAILLGGLVGAAGILSRRLEPGSTLPFAPCLAGGAAATWLLAPDTLLLLAP